MLMIPGGISLFRDRSAAIALLEQYVHDARLKKHCLATGAGMKSLAAHLGEDEAVREATGLLPDIDFELVRGDMQSAWCERCGDPGGSRVSIPVWP